MRLRGLLAVALVTACSVGDSDSVPAQPAPNATEAIPVSAPKPEEPATVRGVVRWSGPKLDGLPRISMSGDEFRELWKDGGPVDPRFEVAADGALPHAFVWAMNGPHKERKWDTPETQVELRGERGMFVPHVLGVMCGQPIALRSSDHHYNFHARPALNRNEVNLCVDRDRTLIDHRPAEDPKAHIVRFNLKEMAIPFNGDIYSWMSAYVFVLDHPFFAVTDAQGRFEIRGLPPGEYVFKAWHEPMTADSKWHQTETTVTLASGATADVAVELR